MLCIVNKTSAAAWKYHNKFKRNSEAVKKGNLVSWSLETASYKIKSFNATKIKTTTYTIYSMTHPRSSKIAVHASLTVSSFMTRWAVITGWQTIIWKYTGFGKLIHSIWSCRTRARATVLGCAISSVTIPTIGALFAMIT